MRRSSTFTTFGYAGGGGTQPSGNPEVGIGESVGGGPDGGGHVGVYDIVGVDVNEEVIVEEPPEGLIFEKLVFCMA